MKATRIAVVLLVLAGLVLAGEAATSAPVRQLVAALRPTRGFMVSTQDPRVFYEPGAEANAAIVADALPGAMRQVEAAQYGRFAIPVRIYVCATIPSYARYTGEPKSGGDTTIARKIFISPKPQNTPERLPFVLTHELSHLQLFQRLSAYRTQSLPTWFKEGLAAYVSEGGGAEGVTERDAARAIRAGPHLVPNDTRGLFSHDSAAAFGLPEHMFYRQAAMSIGYLKTRDPNAFRRLLAAIEGGRSFRQAFTASYRTGIDQAWAGFVTGLSRQP